MRVEYVKSNLIWKKIISAVILVAVPWSFSQALEINKNSKESATKRWKYGFVTEYQCLQTPLQFPPAQGFDPEPPHALLVDAELIKVISTGVMTFFDNGRVTVSRVVGSQLSIDQDYPGAVPVSPGAGHCDDGTYQLVGGNRITVNFASCGAEFPGVSASIGPLEVSGLHANNFRWIKLALTNGGIETMHISIEGYPDQEAQRVCLQTFDLDKM